MWVHLQAGCERIKVDDIEKFHFGKERFGVGSRGFVVDQSDDLLLHSNKWLDVSFLLVVCAPDGDGSDEVGISVGVVEI